MSEDIITIEVPRAMAVELMGLYGEGALRLAPFLGPNLLDEFMLILHRAEIASREASA